MRVFEYAYGRLGNIGITTISSNPQFIGSAGAYTDDPSKNVRDWTVAYKTKFGEDPSLFAAYGYSIMDMFIQTAKKSGANLTTDYLPNYRYVASDFVMPVGNAGMTSFIIRSSAPELIQVFSHPYLSYTLGPFFSSTMSVL